MNATSGYFVCKTSSTKFSPKVQFCWIVAHLGLPKLLTPIKFLRALKEKFSRHHLVESTLPTSQSHFELLQGVKFLRGVWFVTLPPGFVDCVVVLKSYGQLPGIGLWSLAQTVWVKQWVRWPISCDFYTCGPETLLAWVQCCLTPF